MANVSGEGAARAALAALWTNGGFEIMLRMPGLAVSGSDEEQLGLATPQFQDLPVGPAAWRRTAKSDELLLAAGAVAPLLGSKSFASAQELFQTAVGVVMDGVVYVVRGCEAMAVAGVPCAYRLSLEGPGWV